jgi:tryptophanyl-tRNA synthetase
MSASDENSAIFLTDAPAIIRNKIQKYAFSGGCTTSQEQREKGANLEVDVSFQYLQFFMEDDVRLAQIAADYGSGKLLTGEVKAILSDLLIARVREHQTARAAVSDEVIKAFMTVRPLQF